MGWDATHRNQYHPTCLHPLHTTYTPLLYTTFWPWVSMWRIVEIIWPTPLSNRGTTTSTFVRSPNLGSMYVAWYGETGMTMMMMWKVHDVCYCATATAHRHHHSWGTQPWKLVHALSESYILRMIQCLEWCKLAILALLAKMDKQ